MFSKALIWNPHSQRANDGMARVEKKMNGIEDDDEGDEGEEDEEAALDQGEEEPADEEMEDAEAEDAALFM
ncbi:MAG: hypothetical protein BJ554DRAFT_151 [Olpidium bornovanus]|uniref:Uncharacterized protein n=1 Tax=Olpidium bornovanus TaxID=278681 RepID=A0A8H7ZU96_9FUNG|nr:MAG: hypothetical protein BJ554DRAFT_151 [Olpidium bornovanus]